MKSGISLAAGVRSPRQAPPNKGCRQCHSRSKDPAKPFDNRRKPLVYSPPPGRSKKLLRGHYELERAITLRPPPGDPGGVPLYVIKSTTLCFAAALAIFWSEQLFATDTSITNFPYQGVTYIARTNTSLGSPPRTVYMHIMFIDLTAPGIRFKLTPHGGTNETLRQSTLSFLTQQVAQVAINTHFFLPFPDAQIIY